MTRAQLNTTIDTIALVAAIACVFALVSTYSAGVVS